ncbi:MAG: hypothetical protein JSR82_14055 [Verrucomicrobia bacterium]|nr:hypothetical protein [Verrucomicrobiota bacterium]
MQTRLLRLLCVLTVLASLVLLWWVNRSDSPVPPPTNAIKGSERPPASGPSWPAVGSRTAAADTPPAAPASGSAADETRALIVQGARPSLRETTTSAPLLPPEPPPGAVLPLVFGPVPARVDLGALGQERLRQLQEGFLQTVARRPGESADAFRDRWNRAVRLADAQLWPVFGQEVANAFTNARATQP